MSYHEDESAFCDMEFKWKDDDAWYSVSVSLELEAETLTVKYSTFSEIYDSRFTAGEFRTEADVDEFVSRFRPFSQQLQDSQCSDKVSEGITVCAAHKTAHGDIKFYDAVVEAVHHQEHSLANGEEECLCTFVLFWLHGPDCGNLTSASIESICIIEPAAQVDPRIAAFSKLAKEKIRIASLKSSSAHGISASNESSFQKENIILSIQKKSDSSQSRFQDMQSGIKFSGLISTSEGIISKHNQERDEDRDIGGEPSHIFGSIGANSHYFILIDNMEKDMSPSSIKQFIHQQTAVLSQAYVFPSLSQEPFARGAIVVDCRRKLEKIYEFLNNPNHLIVSTQGRPWVMIEKVLRQETFGTTLGSLIPICQDNFQNKLVDKGLSVVHSGSEAYRRARQLRDLFLAFVNHERGLYKSLAFEEKRILQS